MSHGDHEPYVVAVKVDVEPAQVVNVTMKDVPCDTEGILVEYRG